MQKGLYTGNKHLKHRKGYRGMFAYYNSFVFFLKEILVKYMKVNSITKV